MSVPSSPSPLPAGDPLPEPPATRPPASATPFASKLRANAGTGSMTNDTLGAAWRAWRMAAAASNGGRRPGPKRVGGGDPGGGGTALAAAASAEDHHGVEAGSGLAGDKSAAAGSLPSLPLPAPTEDTSPLLDEATATQAALSSTSAPAEVAAAVPGNDLAAGPADTAAVLLPDGIVVPRAWLRPSVAAASPPAGDSLESQPAMPSGLACAIAPTPCDPLWLRCDRLADRRCQSTLASMSDRRCACEHARLITSTWLWVTGTVTWFNLSLFGEHHTKCTAGHS